MFTLFTRVAQVLEVFTGAQGAKGQKKGPRVGAQCCLGTLLTFSVTDHLTLKIILKQSPTLIVLKIRIHLYVGFIYIVWGKA